MSLILTAATVAGYVALAAITLAIAGAVQGAYLRWQERRRTRREAARVHDDRAAFAEIVAAEYGIPHQTRRTEDPR